MTGREERRPFVTPGPGDYEHETKKTPTQIYDEKFREIKRATSRQSRYLEAMYRRKLREVNLFFKRFPSPSTYTIYMRAFIIIIIFFCSFFEGIARSNSLRST